MKSRVVQRSLVGAAALAAVLGVSGCVYYGDPYYDPYYASGGGYYAPGPAPGYYGGGYYREPYRDGYRRRPHRGYY